MDAICIKDLKKDLKREMDDSRYEHTLGRHVYQLLHWQCGYEYDMERAMLAGLMHDCAKCIPNAKKLKLAEKNGLEITELERNNPFMLHAKVGAMLAKVKYDIDDEEVLGAIRWHTTGKPNMNLLEKIVYVADYIEPRRDKAPNLKEIRKLAFMDLDLALLKILEDTLGYLGDSPEEVDSDDQSRPMITIKHQIQGLTRRTIWYEKNSKGDGKDRCRSIRREKSKRYQDPGYFRCFCTWQITLSLPPEATATRCRLWLMRHRRSCTRQDMKQNRWKDIRLLTGS